MVGVPFVSPIRGPVLKHLDFPFLLLAVIAMLFVTFWMIDAAGLCAWFVRRLSKSPTGYSKATLETFKQERSIDDSALLKEWIDLQIIADLTEPVGRLVYWPFVAVLLMLVARNPWWDNWTWPWPLVVIFGINLVLAATSSIVLQRTALRARQIGVARLREKVTEKQRQAASSLVEHESVQAKVLLDEIGALRRGAFVPIDRNPLVGALLVNSSGAVIIELLAMIFAK
jgi:hypothetical protein